MSDEVDSDPIARIEAKFSQGEPQVLQAVLEGFYPQDFTLPDRMPSLGEKLVGFYDKVQLEETDKGRQRILRANRDGAMLLIQPQSSRFVLTLGLKEVDLNELEEHAEIFGEDDE